MTIIRESDLYAPIKAHLEDLGYSVKGEVGKCDMVAVCGDTMIAVELKLSFGLPVLYQALERLPGVDFVYVGVAVPEGRKARANWDAQVPQATRLCRMLGVGLLSLRDGLIVVHADPAPYQPRKHAKKRAKLLGEFNRRSGDHNVGGTTKRPRVTAYREDALRCARALYGHDRRRAVEVRDATGLQKASAILRTNVYGWFEKLDRGIYALSDSGREALVQYADVIAAQERREQRELAA